jgi:hypothetical protein
VYRKRCTAFSDEELTIKKKKELWLEVVLKNIFVICKTPMAKAITKRTLAGYTGAKINAHCFDDLINIIQNKPEQFKKKILRGSFWGIGGKEMKFDAVVGNPPYQSNISNSEENASLSKQIFPAFIQAAVSLNANFVSLITPSRWFTADAQDKSFIKLRDFVKEHNHFVKIYHFPNNKDVFRNVEIAGGVSYFLYNEDYNGDVLFSECSSDSVNSVYRPLFEENLDIVLGMNKFVSILDKVRNSEDFISTMTITQGRNAFGIIGKESELSKISESEPFDDAVEIRCAHEEIRYTRRENITKNLEIVDKWKAFTSKGNGGAGILNNEKPVAIIGKAYIGKPKSACTDSLIPVGSFNTEEEAINLQKYMSTKFLRFMIGILKVSQNISQNVYRFVPVQDFTSKSGIIWNAPIDKIDEQLYRKYNLSGKESALIESMIKPMDA